jgi:hypothetical protein
MSVVTRLQKKKRLGASPRTNSIVPRSEHYSVDRELRSLREEWFPGKNRSRPIESLQAMDGRT